MDNSHSNTMLAEAVKQAIRDFSPDIIIERRFIGILKDYGGFRQLQPAELITRILIESGTMRRLADLRKTGRGMEQDRILREIASMETQYGFSEKYLKATLLSMLAGLEIQFDFNGALSALHSPSPVAKQTPSINHSKETQKSTNASPRFRLLDITRYAKGKNYLVQREELCILNSGNILTDYISNGKKYALFSCDYSPYKNVEVKVISENAWNTTTLVQITMLNRLSKDYRSIRGEIGRINAILDWNYQGENPITKVNENYFDDELLKKHFRIAQKDDVEFTLRCYNIKDGTVRCKLHLTHNGFYIAIYLHFREPKTQNPAPWPLPPSPTGYHYPASPYPYNVVDSHDDDEEEEEEDLYEEEYDDEYDEDEEDEDYYDYESDSGDEWENW